MTAGNCTRGFKDWKKNKVYVLAEGGGCSRYGRQGQYRLARLAAKYSSEIEMAALPAHLAGDCAMWGRQRHPFKEQCGAFFVDIGSPKPPDIPAAMRALKVVR